jgi:Flp pilus assembly protein TadG
MTRKQSIAGLAIVEMAIVLPILMLLTLAAGEFGRAFIQYSRLSHRVQSAARFVAENTLQGTTGVAVLTDSIRTQARNLVLYGTTSAGTKPAVPGLTATDVAITVRPHDGIVNVSIAYAYRPVIGDALPVFGFGQDIATASILLKPRVVMRAL